jgi:hypothetical protein
MKIRIGKKLHLLKERFDFICGKEKMKKKGFKGEYLRNVLFDKKKYFCGYLVLFCDDRCIKSFCLFV